MPWDVYESSTVRMAARSSSGRAVSINPSTEVRTIRKPDQMIFAATMNAAAQAGLASGALTENTQTVTSNYTISTNKNGLSVGPITVSGGVTVTVPVVDGDEEYVEAVCLIMF